MKKLRLPLEPRLLDKDLAAAYCGVSVPLFETSCPVQATRIRGRVLYDRKAIDAWLDSLSGLRAESPRSPEEIASRLDDAYAHQRN